MLRKIICLIVALSAGVVEAEDRWKFDGPPIPMSAPGAASDPELSGLAWHPMKTTNFIICSIDEQQGLYFKQNIEEMKKSCLNKWGFGNFKFTTECKVVIVPNKSLLKKLFGLNSNHAEIRRDAEGRMKLSAIWLSYDSGPEVIYPYLTLVSLKEYEQFNKIKLGNWFLRGAVFLSFNTSQIKGKIASIKVDPIVINNVFEMDEEGWKKLDEAGKEQFDLHAGCVCLLLRKEFGEYNLHKFLKNDSVAGLFEIYGFRREDFSSTVKRYITNLSEDLNNNRTPDSYITINFAR
jgi:hypothetical protein